MLSSSNNRNRAGALLLLAYITMRQTFVTLGQVYIKGSRSSVPMSSLHIVSVAYGSNAE